MWPLESRSGRELVRIGRHAVERWAGSGSTLSLLDSHALVTAGPNAAGLLPAIRALYPTKPDAAVTVLLESAWLPLLLVEVGPTVWTSAQVEPLLRHRLSTLHGDPSQSTAGWDLRIDYHAGERFALGYGMSPRIKQVLAGAADTLGLRWAALLPAFAWGLQRLRPARPWPGRSGWWTWPEQDRLLVAHITGNRVVALNAGAHFTDDAGQIEHRVDIESVRSGIATSSEPIGAASWAEVRVPAAPTGRLSWVTITGQSQPHASAARMSSPTTVRP